MSLTPYVATLEHESRSWATLPEDELKRRAAKAANERDATTLWSLCRAYLYLRGAKGSKTSPHTLKNYERGVRDLLERWQGENLLRPSRDGDVSYIRQLESSGLKPATVGVKLASARLLYRALRWANAAAATPFEDANP